MTIKEKLEGLLKQQHLTQAQFAEMVGVDVSTISAWKRRNSISRKYIRKVAEVLNVDTDYLLDENITSPTIIGNINAPAIAGVNNRIHLTPPVPKQTVNTKIAFITEMLQTFSDDKLDEIIKCLYKNCIE